MEELIFQKEGYRIDKYTISFLWANLFALILMVISAVLFIVPYLLLWGNISFTINWIWYVFLLIGLILHEFIHAITFAILIKDFKFKHIHLGFKWKYLTPYCHCNTPLKKQDYIIGGLMPLILFGIIPSLLGICFHQFEWVIWGIVFSAIAAGDIWVVWETRYLSKDTYILDNPNEIGFFVYEKMV